MTPMRTFSQVRSGDESPSLMKFVSSRISQGDAKVSTDEIRPRKICTRTMLVKALKVARRSACLLPA